MFKNVLSNSMLEKIDIWKGKSGSLLLRAWFTDSSNSITWEPVRNTDSWALPHVHWIRSSLSVRSPSDSDGARGILFETLWYLLSDPGQSTSIVSLFPRNPYRLVWKSFTFHQDYKEYFYVVSCAYLFFSYTATTFINLWFAWKILTFTTIRTYLISMKKIW